ncbi:Chaperone protein DnaJ [Aquisphaera giovannonii]|uniref:Chaperone protein DnaJ n=1 Tax=Aquisphaera giovannonii TaxID=406548 RepID=A0A5B9W114_9BACT|nr:DnaJ domain-containing protein [Aquisphaera giovannonii]QEH33914.1 Chaperone protein DnaJ [Aquisphaera giovannonii]
MATISFEIDPKSVLGVAEDASLDQIRDAYRRKSKILHPDAGGEEWAFRILAQSYEILSTARVRRAAAAEPPHPAAATAASHDARRDRKAGPSSETVRGGFHDADVPADRIVAVEHLCVRYLWDDAAYLFLARKQSDEERFLSCSLNIRWPDENRSAFAMGDEKVASILATLRETFAVMAASPDVVTSHVSDDHDEFAGWLTYRNFDRSWAALKALHAELRRKGLGLRQWSRDLFIPKNWK